MAGLGRDKRGPRGTEFKETSSGSAPGSGRLLTFGAERLTGLASAGFAPVLGHSPVS